jgi:aryl-alcohol dehydrogenase-like predicted oxidoreductase
MRARRLGTSDLELTVIGLGTWAIGGGGWQFGWGPQDDRESVATIRRALDLGINWIDTAPAYGQGHSEEVVGQAIRGRRDEVVVATKCGLVWQEGSPAIEERLKAWSVRKEIDDSLRRLGVETIDLYQIHWPDPDEDIEEAWTVIAEAVRSGKIRYAGVSNFNEAQIRRAQAIHPVTSLQPPYNMIDRGVEDGLLSFCAEQRIGVIAYSPMVVGLLTGRITREWADARPEDDWRRRYSEFRDPKLSANLELVDGLQAIAGRSGKTVAQLAVSWVLRRPEVTAAIVGARRPDQIEETAAAGDWELSAEAAREIEPLLETRRARVSGTT